MQAAPAVVIRESKSIWVRATISFSPSDNADSIVQQGNLLEQGTDEALLAPHGGARLTPSAQTSPALRDGGRGQPDANEQPICAV